MKAKLNIVIVLSWMVLHNTTIRSQTHINLLPGNHVDVGEELYFDALYYNSVFGSTVEYEWDFGDGYALNINSEFTFFESGVCGVHYFMKPGEYKIKLKISKFTFHGETITRGNVLATDSVSITVSGQEVISGFELLHAPFHARTAQYLYAVVPEGYNPSQVRVKVENSGGTYSQELTGTTLDGKQRFLLHNSLLPADDYVVTAELKDESTVISVIKEKFSKPYEGAPATGIDENNSFVLNGSELFLPIGPYMASKDFFPLLGRISNIMHTEGYYDQHDSSTWNDFLQHAHASNLTCIGPSRWQGCSGEVYYRRNSSPDSLVIYVRNSKSSPGLLGWNWYDEPNMGGRQERFPASVLASWSYRTRLEDPQHPVGKQYYGLDYNSYYNPRLGNDGYNYMRSAYLFGGKKTFIGDFFTHDAYLIECKGHPSFDYSNRGLVDIWLENLDNFKWNVADLVPLGTFIEPQNIETFDRISDVTEWSAGPTPGDVRTQAWGSIIHNMKFVGYFINFAPTPAENMSALGELKETVTALAPVILGAPSSKTVTHNATTRGNRVDIMVREYENDMYIFAARITEPKSEWNEVTEPEYIDFHLNSGTGASVAYDEFKKYNWKSIKLDATEGQKVFNCTVPEGGIEPGSIIISAVESPVPAGTPDSLYDRWTHKGYPKVYDMQGNLKYALDDKEGNITPLFSWKGVTGTVNYSSGQIHIKYATAIPAGSGAVQVAYAPSNRQAGYVQITNGIITDKLEQNAVRIYRIPSTGSVVKEINTTRCINLSNYPNPFSVSTKISYELPVSGFVTIKIYDCLGKTVLTLIKQSQTAGKHTIDWNGNTSEGNHSGRGVYLYELQLESKSGLIKSIGKMIIL